MAENPAEEISPTEDLMREHGVLNRLLLIYEEGARRLYTGAEFPTDAFHRASSLMREFIEEYHERLEENWVFPQLERAGALPDLVPVLRLQHDRGRQLTDAMLAPTRPGAHLGPAERARLAQNYLLYSRMYRPHEAREDTVLFPTLRRTLSPEALGALGEQFEREERRRFGEGGFERVVAAVAEIEKGLNINDLTRFTPLEAGGAFYSRG